MYKKDHPTVADWFVILFRVALVIVAPATIRLLRSVPFIVVIVASWLTVLSVLLAEEWPSSSALVLRIVPNIGE